jgi:hypothetical protein
LGADHEPAAGYGPAGIGPELTDSKRTAVLGGTATTLIPRLAAVRLKG